jgi:hypothetical protein
MINIYTAKEARDAADMFCGPIGQIFSNIRENSNDGLYILKVVTDKNLSPKQLNILKGAGYDVTPDAPLPDEDRFVYSISW